MPGTPVLLGIVTQTFSNVMTSGTLSPTAGALIIAVGVGNSGAGWQFSSNGLTVNFAIDTDGDGKGVHYWNHAQTPWNGQLTPKFDSDNVGCLIATCIASGGSPSTGTMSWAIDGGGISGSKMFIYEVTSDFTRDDPIRQFKFGGSTATTDAHTEDFDLTPLSSSRLLMGGGGKDADTTVAPDTSWTESDENVTANQPTNFQHRTSTTSTQFGIGFGTDLSDGIAIGALEIREEITGVSHPTVLARYEFSSGGGTTYTLPESSPGAIPNADDWVIVPVFISNTGGNRTVSSISSTFNVTGDGWHI